MRQDLLLRELGEEGEAHTGPGGVANKALQAPVPSSRGDACVHADAHASSCAPPAPLAPAGKFGTLSVSAPTSPLPLAPSLPPSGAPLGDNGDKHVSGALARLD